MRAYGSDRLRPGEGDVVHLTCRVPKNWHVRVEKTLTSPEHPGTAVLWEEQYFEVIAAEGLPQGGVEYALAPWRDNHAIRVADRYDLETERARFAAHRGDLRRERSRKATNLLGIFAGHLPAAVQEKLSNEYGIPPARLTLMSVLAIFLVAAISIVIFAGSIAAKQPSPIPLWFILLVGAFTVEGTFRLASSTQTGQPMGSLAGCLCYVVFYYLSPRRERLVSPFAVEKGMRSDFMLPPTDDVALRDAFTMREPYVTLLSPVEQHRVARRFGYDYKRLSSKVAMVILVVALIGVFTSLQRLGVNPSVGAFCSFVTAIALLIEQFLRLMSFSKGPVGSMLAVVVRPFLRKIL